MPNVLGFVEINDLFGNIGGVVGNAFKTFGNDHQIEAARDRFRIGHHDLRQLTMNLFVQLIDFLIAWD